MFSRCQNGSLWQQVAKKSLMMATGNTTFLNPGKSIPSDPKNSNLKSINLARQKKRSNFSTSISWSFRKCAKTADLNSAVCF